MSSTNAADQALAYARAQIGKPYVFGATGPDSFDCSGLIFTSYKNAGITLGRTTYQQILNGTAIDKANLAIGDLVFPDAGHVQIYSGNGRVVEAPHSGANVREVAMWGFWRARRIVPGGGTGAITLTADITSISNPVSAVEQLTTVLQNGTAFFELLANGGTYKRAGSIVVGGVGVLMGSYILGKSYIDVPGIAKAATTVAKAVK